ncbi:SMODS domain-containing nucleotidyltransferase [Idiomarina zobellii]|uniref:Nucleotidyltransferase n=1 Tax=Idiomarina zobellii TaxID=86103 RepID=A0A837N6B8_9GAMM|nr:nucleotidyltransferase [Idiomarina zobellii]KPD20790.1 nucleotidyltransferase [Idiomarina zobellii]
MSTSEMFSDFVGNLAISNTSTISLRYGEITSALNKQFRDSESKTSNTLQVGSFGRKTGINGISDLDMLYIMPKSKWETYNTSGGQSKLLKDTKNAILKRYPSTNVRVDRLVVTVTYTNFQVEVQPVFEQDDCSYKYPDTKNSGSWKITKPRDEMDAVNELNTQKNSNLKRLCKMARAWRNQHGMAMGGLLIDTLAYNFLNSTNEYDTRSYSFYDWMSRDFFKYLSELPDQNEYAAPGSRQRVKVKKKFQKKAQKAYKLAKDAIESSGTESENNKWKKLYGRPFPAADKLSKEELGANQKKSWTNTEEFIEDKFSVDIRYQLRIDCEVMQRGFRKFQLREMLDRKIPLKADKKLRFWVKEFPLIGGSSQVYWKVLNRGDVAKKRDCIRGQIVPDGGRRMKEEKSDFLGEHIVECYLVQNNVVVAKDRIHVPIIADGSDYE